MYPQHHQSSCIGISGGYRGVRLVMYFCVHNWTSLSNGYAAMTCSNNNQAQLHTHVSVPYWSPDVWLGLELLRDIQFGLPAILNNSLASYQSVAMTRSGRGNPKIFRCALHTGGWTPLSKFLNPPLSPMSTPMPYLWQGSCLICRPCWLVVFEDCIENIESHRHIYSEWWLLLHSA